MSASLVGSEMCIRDSPHDPVVGTGGTALSAAPPTPNLGRRLRDNSRAVSYTHLTLPTICSV
eukprot:13846426-Alexandrium_andersonii.AAC.1